MRDYNVLIGASGWQHEEWSEEFYPDDLPEEWRLGYYGNEFPVVLIPADYWSEGDSAVSEWLDESDDSPLFICEWPATVTDEHAIEQQLSLLAKLGERLIGILLPVSMQSVNAATILCSRLAALYPVTLDIVQNEHEDVIRSMDTCLANENVGVCWHGGAEYLGELASGRLLVARVCKSELTPRELRFILETCLQQSDAERTVVLIFDGNPPQIKQMNDAGVILELL